MSIDAAPPLSSLLHDAAAKAAAAQDEARRLLGNTPLILFGAGGLGRLILGKLRSIGLEVAALADNNPDRWNTIVEGVRVQSPQEVVDTFRDDGVFVITVWNASRRRNHADIHAQLREMGCRNVISFAQLFRAYPDVFLPYFAIDRIENALSAADAIESVYDWLADDESRSIYRRQIKWRMTADYDGLPAPAVGPHYFPKDVYRLRPDETFVDCGAFDGDTVRPFVALTHGAFARYWALEPDPQNYAKLTALVQSLPADVASRITCLTIAASDRRGTEFFNSNGSASAGFSETGDLSIETAPLDELVDTCTIIKLDVEGAEPRVLQGAERLIRECSPVLAISAYHAQNHLWELPRLVRSLNPAYQFYLREHNAEGFDLVLYAVPPQRHR
jgi:FkbM family methyltransferase